MTENQTHDMIKKELLELGQTPHYTEARLGLYEEYTRHSSYQCQIEGIGENVDAQKHKTTHGGGGGEKPG